MKKGEIIKRLKAIKKLSKLLDDEKYYLIECYIEMAEDIGGILTARDFDRIYNELTTK